MKKLLPAIITVAVVAVVAIAAAPRTAAPPSSLELAIAAAAVAEANAAAIAALAANERAEERASSIAWDAAFAAGGDALLGDAQAQQAAMNKSIAPTRAFATRALKYAEEATAQYERAKAGK